jgi:hypothetical protein
MSNRCVRSLGVLALAFVAACSARPLPTKVQAGSTIGIALASEALEGEWIGYGGQLLRTATPPIYDDQRGELVFVLKKGAAEYELVTQLVTRTGPDPATKTGIDNLVDMPIAGILGLSQVLAIVEIPPPPPGSGPPPDVYSIEVRRKRRISATQWETNLPVPQYSSPVTAGANQIEIIPGTGSPASTHGYLPYFAEGDASQGLRALYPYPKIVLAIPALSQSGSPQPSASHLVVSFPQGKLAIKSVFEEQHLGRGSIVTYSNDTQNGRLTIDLVDPGRSVKSLAIAFDLLDPFGAGRATQADFTVTTADLYDGNGAVASTSPGAIVKGAIR